MQVKNSIIGIGVTTYKSAKALLNFMRKLDEFGTYDYRLCVAQDGFDERKGVAYRKNECLADLKDCEHIFLFDDDCYPIKKGWEDFFINSKQDHLLYLAPYHNWKGNASDVSHYHDCGGVFMYMSRHAVDTVGAFNEKFGIYGFEHADYSRRIHKAGLTETDYQCLRGTRMYLYSEDYSNNNHESVMSKEEKALHIKESFPIFKQPIEQIHIPLENII